MALEEIVRPAESPRQGSGYRARSTRGTNADTPATTFGADGSPTEAGPYARVDQPQDYSRYPQLRKMLAGGQEIASAWRSVSSSVQIDPNACSIWRLKCQSANLTITFADLEGLPEGLQGTIWENAVRVATVEIIIQWMVAAPSGRTLNLSGVTFTDSSAPDWTPTAATDALHVQIFSDGQKLGFVLGLDLGVPA